MKSVGIRSFSDLYFPVFGLNTDRHEVSFRIHPECEKMRTKNLYVRALCTQCAAAVKCAILPHHFVTAIALIINLKVC